ncbi:hypothetical protein, partial [Klebsiella pneumoniae]|uniref:hypothetical protein n=1 Tax=Klebsiella pneumoniae TaxID=573 RepID=UPI001EF31BA5
MVLAFTASLVVLAALGGQRSTVLIALAFGGAAVAAVGFVDDRRPVPPAWRLAGHIASAVWAVAWLGGL